MALILTRRKGESLYVGKEVVLKILELDKCRVKISIEASTEVPILREEVFTKIAMEIKEKRCIKEVSF